MSLLTLRFLWPKSQFFKWGLDPGERASPVRMCSGTGSAQGVGGAGRGCDVHRGLPAPPPPPPAVRGTQPYHVEAEKLLQEPVPQLQVVDLVFQTKLSHQPNRLEQKRNRAAGGHQKVTPALEKVGSQTQNTLLV